MIPRSQFTISKTRFPNSTDFTFDRRLGTSFFTRLLTLFLYLDIYFLGMEIDHIDLVELPDVRVFFWKEF